MLEVRGDDVDLEWFILFYCFVFILVVVCDGSWGIGLMWCGCCLIVVCVMIWFDCFCNVFFGMGFVGFGLES